MYDEDTIFEICLFCNNLIYIADDEAIETSDGWFCHNDCKKAYYPNEE